MLTLGVILFYGLTLTSASGLHSIFPELKKYTYEFKGNVSSGSVVTLSYWTISGSLTVLVYDNYTKARFELDHLKPTVYTKNKGHTSQQSVEALAYLKQQWEVEYLETGFISSIYFGDEPSWSKNMKRAISINFQLKKDLGSYTNNEPCLYALCVMVYTARRNTIKKYSSLQRSSSGTEHTWTSVPWSNEYGRVPENVATSERIYELDEHGLTSLYMKADFRYKVNEHILSVSSELSFYLDGDSPSPTVEKLNVTRHSVQYEASDFNDPTNGIRYMSEGNLKNKTYEILMKIAKRGIDADNIVRNESLIHSLDFIDLLNTISQLSHESLTKLFDDLVLGTSYDLETARNIFLEVLPHARSDACARFIRYLVVEQKTKIEDAILLSLIRKLPFNVANHSQGLLEELETFTKLGLDFPLDIRHAGILSFAILVYKTAEAGQVKQDYFDNVIVKYFRMYSDCPQYLDRMIWLQGLCSLGFGAEAYVRTIYSDASRNRHERLWSSMACGQEARGYMALQALEVSLPILTNETEHIQLRIAALHAILRSEIQATDFLFIHNFITSSDDDQLKRFWYSTVKSLEANRFFEAYRFASYYIPFVANQVTNPDTTYWATNNYIITHGDEFGPSLQVFSIGEEFSAMPAMAGITLSSGGRRPYDTSIYLIAEGVSSHIFKKMRSVSADLNVETLVKVLEKMKIWTLKTPQEVHIDIVIKVEDKTVYATHINQSRFETWNGMEMAKSIMEFLRFGSHINQQMVYYPSQMEMNVPSELGTPIRLQSLSMGFTSVRGNLTAPADPTLDLDWENDLHIRFQGTKVTSLSTYAPLVQSEHTGRVQQSLVAHLPIKFNVTCQASTRSIAFTWLNPFAQRAGIAMHSRVQITTDSALGRDSFTVSSKPISKVNKNGIFFDCEQQTSAAEVLEKYLMSKIINYDTPQTQKTFVDTLHQLTPLPGCGLILPPTRQDQGGDEVIRLKFSLGNISLERVDSVEANFGVVLSYYSLDEKTVFLKIDSNTKIKSTGRNVSAEWNLYVKQPQIADPKKTHWKLCYKEDDVSHAPSDEDITTTPSAYEGLVTITYRSSDKFVSCSTDQSSTIEVKYRGSPKHGDGGLERNVEFQIVGERLHDFDLLPKLGLMGGTPAGQILGSLDKDTINATAVVKEKNGVASLVVNHGPEMKFKSDNIAWLLDSVTGMQLMKKFGFYRECRLQGLTVQTLSGSVDQLQPIQCAETVVLADCSELPSFVILRESAGRIKMYDIDHSAGNSTKAESPLIPINDGVKIASEATGVLIYKKHNETVILVPFAYMDTVCGECVGLDYNNC
ncbi:uncharacterized protein LOC123718124 [Pieris brassicae]|uniref:uncharacterized protein LOC123718124 n=1 Tax=Pieris brassicae TaxID=7116 RepID=UPI001E65F227|nr:uncharacterized protein LOC123718124 [Pieris brassicae]XP_045530478.1 uncharacterized protein LOC123718124 [Pieris brassicae]